MAVLVDPEGPAVGALVMLFNVLCKLAEHAAAELIVESSPPSFPGLLGGGDDDENSHDILSTTWIMNLTQNYVISLYGSSDYWLSGGFYVNIYHPVLFNGHLLMKQ